MVFAAYGAFLCQGRARKCWERKKQLMFLTEEGLEESPHAEPVSISPVQRCFIPPHHKSPVKMSPSDPDVSDPRSPEPLWR